MKKHDIRPFIDATIKDLIYKFSHTTGISILRICEDFCIHSLDNDIGNELSHYFKRDITINGVSYKGDRNAMKFEYQSNDIERITLQLDDKYYDFAHDLAYAMRTSLSKVVGYAIERSINDYEFLNQYVSEFLMENVSERKRDKLLQVVGKVNDENKEVEYNLASLVMYIADEYRRFGEGLDGVLNDCVRE